jgi:RHS repeat-associated protein
VKASRPGLGAGGETLSITRGGWLFFPPVNETLSYDLDGNLTEDARWTYGWDGDNRLIWMEEKPIAGTGPRPPQQRLEYDYDSHSRRIAKRVLRKTHEMGDWSLQQHRQFLYDGWNMIAEIDISISSGTARLHRSYAWGLDASGTLTGAGGVGGLLLTTHYGTAGNSNVTLAPLYDFNSNVLAYADVTTSTITHRIDYDPFGNELTIDTLLPTEAAAEAPRFRFSTKYTDSESGLVYYGYRSYSPELGRWVNRDPIEERGGVNLYGMVGNDAVNRWDVLGLEPADFGPPQKGSPQTPPPGNWPINEFNCAGLAFCELENIQMQETLNRLNNKCASSSENAVCPTGRRKCAFYSITRMRPIQGSIVGGVRHVRDFHIACGDESGYNGYQKNGPNSVTNESIYMDAIYASSGHAMYALKDERDFSVSYFCCPTCSD